MARPQTLKMDVAEVNRVLRYDPITGDFFWRVPTGRRIKSGYTAGWKCARHGYHVIRLHKMAFRAHRLAWVIMTGSWPTYDIDHKDQVRSNNVWSNLREASHSQNQWNKKIDPRNTSGLRGVTFAKKEKKWVSQIYHAGKCLRLGYYPTKEKAYEVYVKKAQELRGEFAVS